MFGFSLGGGLSNRFVAWWGDWRLALDFTGGRYHPKGEAGLVLAETRTSSALVLQGDGTYVERYGPRTNEINSAMEGAVVGVIGSGGVVPDDMVGTGFVEEVLAIGVNSIDVNFQGTTDYPRFSFGPTLPGDSLPATGGEEWILHYWVTRLPGIWDLGGGSLQSVIQTRTAAGAFVGDPAVQLLTDLVEGERCRVRLPLTLSGGIIEAVWPQISCGSSGGSNRNFSLRIEDVQFERGLNDTALISGPAGTSVPSELAIGQGVGGRFSQAVTNLRDHCDLAGMVVGEFPGTAVLPATWVLDRLGTGLTYEITEISEMLGLPSFSMRIHGTATGEPQMFIRTGGATLNSIPAVIGDQFRMSFFARLAGGSLNGISQAWIDAAMWDSGAAFLGRPTANWSEEFSISNFNSEAKRYSQWIELDDAEAAFIDPTINIKFDTEVPIDFTVEIAAFNHTTGKTEYPVLVGTGVGYTRAADNPVVVQGGGGKPWPRYDLVGELSGNQLIEGGSFDVQEDVDLWTAQSSALVSLSSGTMRLENVGANYGGSSLPVPITPGRVYALDGERAASGAGAGSSDCHLGDADSYNKYVNSGQFSNGPFYSLGELDSVNISATVGGNTDGAWKEFDNISLQEVEPGVVIAVEGVWGDADGQHVLRLDDGTSDNVILIRRTSAGTIKLFVAGGGVTLYDAASTAAWPDGIEATFRLEITDTDGGSFFAVFLDEIYLEDLLPGALDYPSPIDQLNLAVVAGVKTIKSLNAR